MNNVLWSVALDELDIINRRMFIGLEILLVTGGALSFYFASGILFPAVFVAVAVLIAALFLVSLEAWRETKRTNKQTLFGSPRGESARLSCAIAALKQRQGCRNRTCGGR